MKIKRGTTQESTKIISGRMILNKGIPAAFIDSNSYLSPKLPNVIKAANKIAKGRDKGIKVRAE